MCKCGTGVTRLSAARQPIYDAAAGLKCLNSGTNARSAPRAAIEQSTTVHSGDPDRETLTDSPFREIACKYLQRYMERLLRDRC
jgi:hypothetical protein